jgi:hypothetical protein
VAVRSARLAAYLTLERAMLALDAAGDPFADRLRDVMDPLWYSLTDEEHALLDARQVVDIADPAMSAPMGEGFFRAPPPDRPVISRTEPLTIEDWRSVA